MNVAIDISPLSNGHKVRGVGFYVENLRHALLTYFPWYTFTFFTNSKELGNEIEVVHYPYFDPFSLTLPFKKTKKTVITIHDLTPIVYSRHFPVGVKGSIKWIIQKHRARKAGFIITDSECSKRDIIRLMGIPEEKIAVVYLSVSDAFKTIESKRVLTDINRKYDLPKQFVLYVGDVTWNKNLPMLVKACIASNIPLVLVGKALVNEDYDKTHPWNSDLVEVQELAQKHSNIIRLGFVPSDDIVAIYNLATVFAFPSVYEGFGLPILEAMKSGCPVIASNSSSMVEVAGEAAHYVDVTSEESLRMGIELVMSDEKLRETLSKKGLHQAKQFTWEKTAQGTIAVYKAVLGK